MSTIERAGRHGPASPSVEPPSGQGAADPLTDQMADKVDETIADNPAVERLTRLGWIAKGAVYTLMGGAAISIAQSGGSRSSDEEASPNGALDTVIEQPGGRVVLGVLAVGLALYCVWRILSVAVIRSNKAEAWLDRIGYTFSAVFYGVLTYVAARAAINGVDPDRDNFVERWSRRAMEWQLGRWLVMAAGIVTLGVGLYFIVKKGIMRSFCDDLTSVSGDQRDDMAERALVVSGVVGWIGRGIVTVLVGFFVTRAAWRFDPDDARGFDAALRRLASTETGTVFVWIAGIGLVVYGIFCLLSHRRRRLKDYTA